MPERLSGQPERRITVPDTLSRHPEKRYEQVDSQDNQTNLMAG